MLSKIGPQVFESNSVSEVDSLVLLRCGQKCRVGVEREAQFSHCIGLGSGEQVAVFVER